MLSIHCAQNSPRSFHTPAETVPSYCDVGSTNTTESTSYHQYGAQFDLRGRAFHPFLRPLASMMLAGMQYTGSKSTNPGYPRSERPNQDEEHIELKRPPRKSKRSLPATPNCVWNTSAISPGRSAIPPNSGSCEDRMNATSLSASIHVILFRIDSAESTQNE